VDYTMRTEKEKRFVELTLDFENNSKIQIAFIDYILEENQAPRDFSFDLSTNLLISTKQVFEIKT
jgi:6-phosphogluconolactonase (cycloisomerase 2 family)